MNFLNRLPLLHRLSNPRPENTPDDATEDGALLSAYFGLDNGIGPLHRDGIPVVLETEVDVSSLDAEDFQVTNAEGEVMEVNHVTILPAHDEGEQRTVLLLGEFGSPDNQPVSVEVVGDVISQDGTTNYKGASVDVAPLEAGPSLVYAEEVSEEEFGTADIGTVPAAGGTVIRTTWDGGVTQSNGEELDETNLEDFSITVRLDSGEIVEVSPVAMSDLNDHDNNQLLYLPVEGTPLSVSVAAEEVADPGGDPNPETSITIEPLQEEAVAPYDNIIYFGDSFTDSGEFFALTSELLVQPFPSPEFGYDGQVSNGPVYADITPALLGIDADGSLNYAVGGAQAVGEQDMGTLLANSPAAKPGVDPVNSSYDINLGAQVDRFLEDAAEIGDLSNSAASITIGSNDFRQLADVIDPENPDPAALQSAATQLSQDVLSATLDAAMELAEAGVGTIILNTLPLVDREDPTPEQNLLSGIISSYNDALIASSAGLEQLGVDVVIVGFQAMMQEMTRNGSNYGFLNTEDARQDGPQPVDPDGDGPLPASLGYIENPEVAALDPDQHVFFDTIHPTTAAHGVLGAYQAATLAGDTVTFLGDASDSETGTDKADLIFAQGGNDHIHLGMGNDAAFGGTGHDNMHGGKGQDILAGGDGGDILRGGRDADVLSGNQGDDHLRGGEGNDVLIDGLGSDRAYGGTGDDVFLFTEAALIGGETIADQDLLVGGAGYDIAYLVLDAATRVEVESALSNGVAPLIRLDVIGLTLQGIEEVVILDDRSQFHEIELDTGFQNTFDEAVAWNLI